MADRRMMTKKVTDDDAFMALSSSAQALYLHLYMSADDDGFSKQVAISMFRAHASVQDLQALLEARYIYQFENGVIVIMHWRMANALRKDRYTKTVFQNEMQKLQLDENGQYHMVANGLPDGCQMVAADKNRIEENRIDNSISVKPPKRFTPPTREEVAAYCTERGNKVDPDRFVDFYTSKGWMVGKSPMKDWKAAVRGWEREAKQKAEKPQNRFAVKDNANDYDFDALERRKLNSRNQSK